MSEESELTAKEASEQYNLSVGYLIRLAKKGKIKGRQIGGFMWLLDRASIEAYVSQPHKPGVAKGTPAPWRKKAKEKPKSERRAAA